MSSIRKSAAVGVGRILEIFINRIRFHMLIPTIFREPVQVLTRCKRFIDRNTCATNWQAQDGL